MAVLGGVDSVAQPSSGQKVQRSTRPPRRCTYPWLCRPLRSARYGLTRSSLKMKWVDPARVRVSALHGGFDAAGLKGHSGIGRQVEPAACDGSVLCFVAPSTCMGPPLTESPGWCQVSSRMARGGAHQGQARPRASPFTMEWQVLEGMAGTSAPASGAGHDISSSCDTLRERPARIAGRLQTLALRTASTGL